MGQSRTSYISPSEGLTIRVRFIIDAEEAVYQPALDGYTLLLSMKYNKPPTNPTAESGWTGPVI